MEARKKLDSSNYEEMERGICKMVRKCLSMQHMQYVQYVHDLLCTLTEGDGDED